MFTEGYMNIKVLLGKRIQELRKSNGLTQENMAELIGIEPSSISNIENGKYYPTAENLEKIINVLNTTPEKLFSFGHLQSNDDLLNEINSILMENKNKMQEIYKIIKALTEN